MTIAWLGTRCDCACYDVHIYIHILFLFSIHGISHHHHLLPRWSNINYTVQQIISERMHIYENLHRHQMIKGPRNRNMVRNQAQEIVKVVAMISEIQNTQILFHLEKSRKHKKKHHQSKKSSAEKRDYNDDAPPLPPDETIPPPPPPPLPLSNSLDETEESSTTNDLVMKTNLPLSRSPPPVMPNILRQGSRPRLIAKEQLVPSPVMQCNETNENSKSSPTSTTNTNHTEDLAAKKFEEQLALLDATSSKLTMNNWEQSSEGSEGDEQIERICRMNNTGSITGPIQFKFNRTQHLPLKTSAVSNDVANNEEEPEPVVMSTRKKRLHKPNDPTTGSHSSLSGDENEKALQNKKQKTSENESSEPVTTDEQQTAPVTADGDEKPVAVKSEEPVASTTVEKKSEEDDNGGDRKHGSRSSSASSRSRRHSSHRRHRNRRRRRRRHSSSSSSRSSYSSTSSDSSRSSSSRSHRRRRRQRSRSSRSSSRSSTSSSDNRSRQSSRSSRRSSRSYSRRRSSSSRSSRSSTSSQSSNSRSRSRSHNRKTSRRSNNGHQLQSHNNGKGRGGAARRGRGARNGPRGRRARSNDNLRRSPPTNRNGNKYNGPLGGAGIRKLPNNKQPRVLIAATPKLPNSEENVDETAATSTTGVSSEENKVEPIILTTNQNQQRTIGQKKNVKGKNKQQTPAYSLKKEENEDMEQDDDDPIIGPKLPPEFEKKISKDHSFTPPDMDDPDNIEMLNDLKYRAEIHAAKNHGLITEIQAQQLIEERETQRQLADFPLIQMPIMPSPAISSMPSFIVAAPNPVLTNYHHLQVASATVPQIAANPDTSSVTLEQQQQQQQQQQLQQQLQLHLQQQQQQQQSQVQSQTSVSPNSAASSGGESCSTPGQTTPNGTTNVLTQDGQPMMIQTATNGSPQLVQIAQPAQQLYMPMQAAVQQPRVVAVRTPQGGLQHFIEYPTAQLLQAQQSQQPQFIQHNGQLVQVIRPSVAYSAPTFMQQIQLQQQQQQVLAAQLQAQQLAAMQQTGGAVLMQNSAGQLVLAQPNPQAMRVVQIPYVPK
ncbi:unnamed protein product [Adineta ricciae]|uniref:Uncharacterized protein n=1 Tax=Adineta ricciae TaxID=249248 RepID=A0A813TCZ3_ADIRI|nr:unnamed protein product [Adineta ricciae]